MVCVKGNAHFGLHAQHRTLPGLSHCHMARGPPAIGHSPGAALVWVGGVCVGYQLLVRLTEVSVGAPERMCCQIVYKEVSVTKLLLVFVCSVLEELRSSPEDMCSNH